MKPWFLMFSKFIGMGGYVGVNSLVHSLPSNDAMDVTIFMIRVIIAGCLEFLMSPSMILL